MKRGLLLLFGFILLLSGCETASVPVSTSEVLREPQPENPVKTITISCAGDCTLGIDESFGGMTLPKEAEALDEDYGWFLRNVLPIFGKDDLTMVNLEGTLTRRGTRQEKTYAFRGDPKYVSILTAGSVEAVTLANNHSMDYGEVGFADTKETLDTVGVCWVENLHTRIKEVEGVKIGLIGLYDLDGSALSVLPKAMNQVKNEGAQLIVVQIHWGIEGAETPSARQREIAHAAINAGADMVMGHHPHVLQGLEEYKGKMIAYSLGNFCFGGNQNPADKDSMIFQQSFIVKNGIVQSESKWQVYPCSISSVPERNNYQPTPLFGDEGTSVRKKIQERTDAIGELSVRFATGV